MELGFVKDLNESSQYRTRFNLASVSARTIADHAFMDIIALWILYNEYDYAPAAVEYARKTKLFGGFNTYRQSATDLYMTLYVLSTKNVDIIHGDEASKLLLDRIVVDSNDISTYLKKIANNSLTSVIARQTLQKAERDFKINESNYRSIRRLAQNWGLLTNNQKELVVGRMVQFYDAHARKSEMGHMLKELAHHKGLDINNFSDAEEHKLSGIGSTSKIAKLGATGMAKI